MLFHDEIITTLSEKSTVGFGAGKPAYRANDKHLTKTF
jgi:hypothetical protein